MQSIRGEAEDHVALFDPRTVQRLLPVHHADDGPSEVIFPALIHSRHLRRLPADERAAAFLAGLGKAFDELREHRRLQPLAADVIEEKQRPRPDHGDVIDAMIHQALAHRVVLVRGKGQLQLRPHAIHAGDEHRVLHPLEIRAKQPAETADLPQHLRPVRPLDQRMDAALHAVAQVHVHPGGGVGFF